jgi:hypothetical protein
MRTLAYQDYTARLREAITLVRAGLEATNALFAGACAKGATVLVTAALERYVGDAVREACGRLKVQFWSALPPGQEMYYMRQFASRLDEAIKGVAGDALALPEKRARFRKVFKECEEAFRDPSTWPHQPEYGLFGTADSEPNRLESFLSRFDASGRKLYTGLDGKLGGRGAILRGFAELIDRRHGAAHALPGSGPPSPADVAGWIRLSFILCREIDAYLRRAVP